MTPDGVGRNRTSISGSSIRRLDHVGNHPKSARWESTPQLSSSSLDWRQQLRDPGPCLDHDLLFGCQRSSFISAARGPRAAVTPVETGTINGPALSAVGRSLDASHPVFSNRESALATISGTGTRTPYCGFRDRRPTWWTIPDDHSLLLQCVRRGSNPHPPG